MLIRFIIDEGTLKRYHMHRIEIVASQKVRTNDANDQGESGIHISGILFLAEPE